MGIKLSSSFAKNIEILRCKKKWTYNELVHRTGIARVMLYRYRRDLANANPSLNQLKKFKRAFNSRTPSYTYRGRPVITGRYAP